MCECHSKTGCRSVGDGFSAPHSALQTACWAAFRGRSALFDSDQDDPVKAQQLAERPGLKRAALWLKWRLGIGNFRRWPRPNVWTRVSSGSRNWARASRRAAAVLPRTRTHASTNGPISQGQTVP